jgi:hypothetical protein
MQKWKVNWELALVLLLTALFWACVGFCWFYI